MLNILKEGTEFPTVISQHLAMHLHIAGHTVVLIHALNIRLLGTYNVPGSVLGTGTQQRTKQMQSAILDLTMVLTQ